MAKFYINYAETATYLQNYRASLTILNEAIERFETQKDSTLHEFGYAYLKAGENSIKINSISESAKYFKKSSEIFTFQKDTLYFLWTQNGLSTLFSTNGLFDEAEQARLPIYSLGKQINEKQVVAIAHVRAAIDASIQSNPKNELNHIKLALKNIKSDSDISEIVHILTLSFAVSTYARQDRLALSNQYLKELNTKINKNTNNTFLKTYYTLALAYNANANGKYHQAEQYASSIIDDITTSNEASNLLQLENLLASINENMGNTQQALNHYKNYILIKDSIDKATSRKKFAYVQSLFESEKKDLEISKQQKNIVLLSTENKLKNQWLIFGGTALAAIFIMIYLWRSRKYAKQKEQLQNTFSRNLIRHVEQERKHISSELHDGIGQNLLLIKNKTQQTNANKEVLSLIEDTINDIRNTSQRLHPFRFEKLGLIASLKYTIETFQKNSSIYYSEAINPTQETISKDKEIFIYRMIQECLNNVEKHSKAKACKVSLLEQPSCLIFEVKDNGIGFSVSKNSSLLNSLGLKTLKERAQLIGAELSIKSKKNQGTTIIIKVPK